MSMSNLPYVTDISAQYNTQSATGIPGPSNFFIRMESPKSGFTLINTEFHRKLTELMRSGDHWNPQSGS